MFRVALLRGGGLLLTLALSALQAAAFGTGPAADAFHLVRQTLASASSALEAAVQKLLVPAYVHSGPGRGALWPPVLRTLLPTTALALVLALAAPLAVTALAPGFTGDQRALAVSLFRLLVMGLPLYAATAALASHAFAGRRFGPASAAALLPRVFALAGFGLAGMALGVVGLAAWLLAGMVAMAAVVLVDALRARTAEAAAPRPAPRSRQRAAAMAVFFASEVALTWSTGLLASLGPTGTAALLFLSLRLLQAAPAMANTAVSTVYYTEYARQSQDARSLRAATMAAGLHTTLFLVLPVLGLLLVAAGPLIDLLLERGDFTAADTARMAVLLRLLAPTVLLNAVFATLYTAAMADEGQRLLRLTLWTSITALGVRLALGLWLVPLMGAEGLALAILLDGMAQLAVLVALTRGDYGAMFDRKLGRDTARLLACTLGAALLCWPFTALPALVLAALYGLAYLALAALLGVPEVRRPLARLFRA